MKQNEEKKTTNLPVPPELIARAKAGEQAAYTELYETTGPALYRSVRSMVHDEDLAWDIVQESYIRAFRSLDKLGANEAFLPWLRRIAVNETARAAAERRPLRFSELEDEEGELPELPDLRTDGQPELILDRQETSRLVREILADLPEQQNVIVGMRYYEDLSVREISELLKLAPGTVKAQLHRGRKHVEDRVRALEKQGVKLYGLSPMAFLVSLLRRLEPAAGAERTVLGTVLVNTPPAGASVGAAAGTGVGAASGAVTTVTAMTTGQAILHGLGAKIAAGVLCAALIGGGIWAGGRALRQKEPETLGDQRPTEQVTEPYSEAQTDPTRSVTEPDATESALPGSPVDPETEAEIRTLLDDGKPISAEMGNYIRALSCEYEKPTDVDLNRLFADFTGILSDGERAALRKLRVNEEDYAWDSDREWAKVPSAEVNAVLTELFGMDRSDFAAVRETTDAELLGGVWTYLPEFDCYYAFHTSTGLRSIQIEELLCTDDGRIFVNYVYQDESGEKMTAVLRTVDGRYLILANLPRDTVLADPDAIGTEPEVTEAPLPETLSGDCGENLRWSFDPETGTLRFEGSGEMNDYYLEGWYPEWASLLKHIRSIELPEGLTSIGGSAFEYCTALTEVTIPDSVTSIGSAAFNSCGSLTAIHVGADNPHYCSVDGVLFDKEQSELIQYPCGKQDASYLIPEGVRHVSRRAFADCKYLKEATIPASLLYIEQYVLPFDGCESLTDILVAPTNTMLCSLDGVLYDKSQTSLLEYPCGKQDASYELPGGLRYIGCHAFADCTFLRELTMPGTVEQIEDYAFSRCTGLTNVRFSKGLLQIGFCAFEGCSALTEVTLSDQVAEIEGMAFNGCTSLASYQVAPGNPNFCTQDGVLFNREKTTLLKYPAGKRDASYEIPAGVTEIALRSFEDSAYLTELTIPDSVTTIGGLAFQNCTALTSVTIPRGAESVGHDAFRNCTALTSVVLPEGLMMVDSEAFLDCISLTEVTIPDSVTDISYYAFGYRDLDIGFNGVNWGLKEAAAKVAGFTIYGQPGSEAQRYAEENGFAFVRIS
jgi:RNA polymerase sigma factor (sigma-70 family)